MAESSSSSTATTPPATSQFPPINPTDLNLSTPLQQRHAMPRAPATPQLSDAFNLSSLSDSLSVVTSAGAMTNITPLPYPVFTPPTTHPILGIHITNYIKFQVSSAGANYSKWRQIIISLLTMYRAMDHITEGAAPSAHNDTWQAVDIHISLWFLATLSDDLHRLVQGSDGRACTTWTRLHQFFLDNCATRYLYLRKSFRNCPRGDLSIADYTSKLQGLADDLAAIGRPVDDRDLTPAFLDGFGKSYKMQTSILRNAKPLPTFAEACSSLQLEALSDASEQQHESSEVMVAQRDDRRPPPASGGSQPRIPGVSPNYRGNNTIPGFVYGQGSNQHGRGGGAPPYTGSAQGRGRGHPGGGRGHGDSSGGRGSGQQPWMGYFAPMSMPFPPPRAPWIAPNAHGVLGGHPGAANQAYPIVQPQALAPGPASLTATGSSAQQSSAPSWDEHTLYQQAPSYGSALSPYGGDWIMDSGASSHVTSD